MVSSKQLQNLRDFFSQYYEEHAEEIQFPAQMREREFGFFRFQEGVVLRHIGFASKRDALSFIRETVPRHAYYSTAYYADPSAGRMQEKGWKGADLIFDIDADHFSTPCRIDHDSWVCNTCGASGRGDKPSNCPECKGVQFTQYTWMCKSCLEYAKDQVFQLVEEFLVPDFGVKHSDIKIVFSGHRGYHVHVSADVFLQLSSASRREIVDYVMGRGVNPGALGFEKIGSTFNGPSIKQKGWSGRLARAIIHYLERVDVEDLKTIENWTLSKAKKIQERRQTIIQKLKEPNPYWDSQAGLRLEQWVALAKVAALEFGAKVDEPVTSDVHRLIRLPGSLHGKTGLKAQIISYGDLNKYDPFKNPIVFTGEVKVYVKKSPLLELGDEVYEPMEEKTCTLDKAAGVYLLAQGLAELVN